MAEPTGIESSSTLSMYQKSLSATCMSETRVFPNQLRLASTWFGFWVGCDINKKEANAS